LGIIDIGKDSKGYDKYLLTLDARREIENLPTEYRDRPYEYFKNTETEKEKRQAEVSKLEFENLTLNVEDLKNKFFDYPETKKLAKSAKHWSIGASVATVLTLILLLIQWICNKPS
jgi:hypothetical protein